MIEIGNFRVHHYRFVTGDYITFMVETRLLELNDGMNYEEVEGEYIKYK